MKPRPDTYDPWKFLQWVMENEHELYVRLLVSDPETKALTFKLVCLSDLDPERWCYWVQRYFLHREAMVKTKEEWADWERGHADGASDIAASS